MSAGITRSHGYAIMPSQRPSTILFYSLVIPAQNCTSEMTVVNGAFDQIFRTALPQFATVAFVGTATYTGGNTVVNFAIEATGVDSLSPTGLGLGSSENSSAYSSGAAYGTTTQVALQNAVQSLGSAAGVNSINLSSATIYFGVTGTTSTAATIFGL